jgi:iron complex transport system ATP-binding protein
MNARNMHDFSLVAGLLEVVGVGVEVPGRLLLRAASAQFSAGQVTAVLGPNGAGKSPAPAHGRCCLSGRQGAGRVCAA